MMWYESLRAASDHRTHFDRLERWDGLSHRRRELRFGNVGLLIVYYVFSFWAGWKWPTQFGTVAHLELVLIALGSLVVAMIFYLCLIITEDQLRRLEGRDA